MEPFELQLKPTTTEHGTAELLTLKAWEAFSEISAGFSTRGGGVSLAPRHSLNTALHVGDAPEAVLRNRQIIADTLNWPFEAWTCAEQVHSSRVQVVTSAERGQGRLDRESAIQDTDALITNEADILLVMYFADCVPLYFYDSGTGAIGLAHAGWKGTVANIALHTLERMAEQYGTRAVDVYGAIGPSIGACCYEVDEAVMQHVRPWMAADVEGKYAFSANEGKFRLDLKEMNRRLMIKAGILPSRIEMSLGCTSCQTDLFFSHRQERGMTGRMMSWLGKRK